MKKFCNIYRKDRCTHITDKQSRLCSGNASRSMGFGRGIAELEKQHLLESSPGRILRNEVRENSSGRWGEVREDAELK